MRRIVSLGLAAVLSAYGLQSCTLAQDVYETYYGQGVHAYFSGRYDLAQEHFDELINVGSQDPRVHYYRGLSQIRLGGGMVEAGIPDFEQAAQLEVSGKRSADIGRALARIQGPTRIAIERIRIKARMAARTLQADAQAADPSLAPGAIAPGTMAPGATLPGSSSPSNAADPYAPGASMPSGQPQPMPTQPEEPAPAPASPFDNAPAPAPTQPMPDTSNPFGDDATTPAPTTPAPTTPAPTDPSNPFG